MALDKNDATSYDNDAPDKAHSSSGPGRRPLKAEITGSTPVCATTYAFRTVSSQIRSGLGRFCFWRSPSVQQRALIVFSARHMSNEVAVWIWLTLDIHPKEAKVSMCRERRRRRLIDGEL